MITRYIIYIIELKSIKRGAVMKKLLGLALIPVIVSSVNAKDCVSIRDAMELEKDQKIQEFQIRHLEEEFKVVRGAVEELDRKLNKEIAETKRELKKEINTLSKELEKTKQELEKIQSEGFVVVRRANFRREPSLNAEIITKLNRGTKVQVLGKEGNWYRVKVYDTIGYLHKITMITHYKGE